MWNELEVYRPHTTDTNVLTKRAEEDKIFQLLASLGPEFEDLRSHVLMNTELPSFSGVCAIIQREEVRKKVMNQETKTSLPDARAYSSYRFEGKAYKGKRPDLKCSYCDNNGHTRDKCWILHPELRPKFLKDMKWPPKNQHSSSFYKANHATSQTEGMTNFTTNPAALINEFAAYLCSKQEHSRGDSTSAPDEKNHTALLGKFAGFLAEQESVLPKDIPGINHALSTALTASNEHDFWIIDSGATDHMTNRVTNLHDFKKLPQPSLVSVANGKSVSVEGKGKIHIMSTNIESVALYIPTFPFQLLSVGAITNSLNCQAIFSPHNVIFQDVITKETIGEGFFLNGLY